jgi:hypothetical protein
MINQKLINALACACLLLFILGCTSTSAISNSNPNGEDKPNVQSSLKDIYANLSKSDGKVLVLDPKLSTLKIYAFRGGVAPALGHNHVLTSPNFTGFIFLPAKGISNARFDLTFRLDLLEFENIPDNSKLGEAFSSQLSSDEIKRTREHMLGDDNLQADRFPFVRFHSIHIAGELPKLAAEFQIELHGQNQTMSIPLNLEVLPNRVTVSGSLVLRQSDFGVKPYSVLGGFLAIQNEVVIEFTLVGN